MTSAIDPTQPPQGAATTAAVRDNFTAAKSEIENLQAAAATAADQLSGIEPVPQIIIGDPGNEGAGILVAGVLYPCAAKISDIGSAYPPIETVHRHSTALQTICLAARSNSDDATHANVTAGMTLWSRMVAGWAGASYKIFGALNFGVKAGATPSDTSAPGRFSIDVTQSGEIWPTEILGGDEDGITSAVPLSVPPGATGAQAISADDVAAMVPPVLLSMLQAPLARWDGIGLQEFFPTGQDEFNLEAGTTYLMEGHASIIRTAGTYLHKMQCAMTGTATYLAARYVCICRENARAAATPRTPSIQEYAGTAPSTLLTVSSDFSGVSSVTMDFSGTFITNSAGTFIPKFSYDNGTGGTPTVERGTYFKLTKIGTSSTTVIGNVS